MLTYTGFWCLVVSLMTLSLVSSMPSGISSTASTTTSTTARANVSPISDTMKQLAEQLMQLNASSHITFDTRTPPKFREQTRKGGYTEIIEFGHPGVAEPVDDEALILEEEKKKMNFYKVDKSTTDSGLSTWILLSGQSSTNKPTKKPHVQMKNATANNNNDENKVIKPIFKRKSTTPLPTPNGSTTKKPTAVVSTTLKATIATTTGVTTEKPEKTTKLSKVKASPVNSNNHNKTSSSPKKTTVSTSSTTTAKPSKTTTKINSSTTTKTFVSTTKSDFVKVPTKSSTTGDLLPEAKEGTLDLSMSTSDKKGKRTTTSTPPKKKKNKNRRKKPIAEDKMEASNGTKLATKTKERPIGSQIYNYLSREVMPTVGVGLVGLMVTAGLASYFLYPFGALRRSYEIDRKDKDGNYHYTDEYTGGIAEEEAIGKVIAGMPSNNFYNTRSHNSRNTYGLNDYNRGINPSYQHQSPQNSRFRNVEQRFMEGTVETVVLNPLTAYKTEEVIIGSPKKTGYSNHKDTYEPFDKLEHGKESVSIINDEQFVVGNVPQEISIQATTESATPAVVPEHGPRTIESKEDDEQEKVFVVESVPAHAEAYYAMQHMPRRRRKRQTRKIDKPEKDFDNEIDVGDKKVTNKKETMFTTLATPINTWQYPTLPPSDSTKDTLYDTTTPEEFYTTMNPIIEKTESIFSLIKDLLYMKLRLSLQILHDKAESLTRYFKTVQERIDGTYRNVNQTISYN